MPRSFAPYKRLLIINIGFDRFVNKFTKLSLHTQCCLIRFTNPIFSFRYRQTSPPLASFEVELFLALRGNQTLAYPLASHADGLILEIIESHNGQVTMSKNEVAYAKLFNVQRAAEFCDLSTMNGMFRQDQFLARRDCFSLNQKVDL